MGKLRFLLALWAAKLSVPALKLTRHAGTDFPGWLAIRLCPDFLRYVGKPPRIVAVTGTNGKTTTTNMIADMLERDGQRVLSNRAGSNMHTGVAAALLSGCDLLGRPRGYDAAVLEIDERSSPLIYPAVTPDVLAVTNLYRDSIKRNGHCEYIFGKIAGALPASTALVLNGNDAVSGLLGEGINPRRTFFSVERTERSFDVCPHQACDISACPRCGHMLSYEFYHFHHVGVPRCEHCGFAMPESDYTACDVDFDGGRFVLRRRDREPLTLAFGAGELFNVFNVTAAAAVCSELGVSDGAIVAAAEQLGAGTVRFDEASAGALRVVTMLAKNQNPISTTQSLTHLSHAAGDKVAVLLVTDSKDAQHGHEDISWLYDTDFEPLKAEDVRRVFLGGRRCRDLALRLVLAGVPEDKLLLYPDYDELARELPEKTGGSGTVCIFYELYAKPIAMGLKQALLERFGEEVEA